MPRAAASRMISIGKCSVSSHSTACGAMRSSAKAFAMSRTASWSEVRMNMGSKPTLSRRGPRGERRLRSTVPIFPDKFGRRGARIRRGTGLKAERRRKTLLRRIGRRLFEGVAGCALWGASTRLGAFAEPFDQSVGEVGDTILRHAIPPAAGRKMRPEPAEFRIDSAPDGPAQRALDNAACDDGSSLTWVKPRARLLR